MEKTAQDHSAQAVKLRQAKEEAEARQMQIKKESQEEIERMKTQFTFKRQEMETTTRKGQWSTRSKRINTENPPTPLNVPSQMSGWNAGVVRSESLSAVNETPKALRFGLIPNESPNAARIRKPSFMAVEKKQPKLPGFYNAFATSTPARNSKPQTSIDSGKGKARASPYGPPPSQFNFSSTGPGRPSPPSSPTRVRIGSDLDIPSDDGPNFGPNDGDGDTVRDVEMGDDNVDELSEEVEYIDSPNWREELHRIILMHTPPSSKSAAFQTLIRSSAEYAMPAESAEAYSKACSRTLGVLAANYLEWEAALYTVAESLTDMANILSRNNAMPPLTALLTLLTNLSYTLPSFSSFLLCPSVDGSPRILAIICGVIRQRLAPQQVSDAETFRALAEGVIGLLESLCWNIPDDLQYHLGYIPRSPQVLAVLLDSIQPLWLLHRSSKLLVYLSSRPLLFRALLSYPDPDAAAAAGKDFTKIPHIERLCALLVDVSFQDPHQAVGLKDAILAFFNMLALAHVDALTILVESLTLIPSLVLHLTHLVTPFREDDWQLIDSPLRTASVIRAMTRTVLLLNYLVFCTEPTANLRQKLHHAPHRAFNGITYMFIVTLGYLSYADPPDWVNDEGRAELEHLADMTRDLLDLVVEGPEGDSVYAAYQDDADDGSVTDDEEIEARMLEGS
ncbi:hypothetical protein FIBSPDRAFT_828969 [Athelia psychrophila]|uniref:Uncharacterized protein n=1 Tax=Athelia psychrophila TaxID=1759441 RepID=A0A166HBR2_9AGAM|nr:hypothetical protein FIBSPDRAFT_828969 [Fibularhizoctonia sp. CBS 109695]